MDRYLESLNRQIKRTDAKQTLWALTFSKDLVRVVVLIFIIATVYIGIKLSNCYDYTAITPLYTDICDLVKVVAFGYLVKSGIENVPKIIFGRKVNDNTDEDTDEVKG